MDPAIPDPLTFSRFFTWTSTSTSGSITQSLIFASHFICCFLILVLLSVSVQLLDNFSLPQSPSNDFEVNFCSLKHHYASIRLRGLSGVYHEVLAEVFEALAPATRCRARESLEVLEAMQRCYTRIVIPAHMAPRLVPSWERSDPTAQK
ncbi:hypothetical protein CPC08DRAFT_367216 [Agrocybe pediades]|nr:hypothetical protein CPC08DRAFT_367216 [Agrocybe pediades]